MSAKRLFVLAILFAFVLLLSGCPEKEPEEEDDPPDINGPQTPKELKVEVSDAAVRFKWLLPTKADSLFNRDLTGFLILRADGQATNAQPARTDAPLVGETYLDQRVIADISVEPTKDLEIEVAFDDVNVQKAVTYHYQIFSYDEVRNYSEPARVEATPGGLTGPRLSHTQTLLGDGRVLLTGGIGYGGPLDTAEIFDPETESFRAIEDLMSVRRFGHEATLLDDGGVLLTGGYEEGFLDTLDSAEIFDPATETFRRLGSRLSDGRALHTATRLSDGRVLIAGGTDGVNGLVSSDLFDPEIESFITIEDEMAAGRYGQTATVITTPENVPLVMIAGGLDDENAIGTATFFDPSIADFGRFEPLPEDEEEPMVVARALHTATPLSDDRVVLAGGFSGSQVSGSPTSSVEIFDPATGGFEAFGVLATPRSGHVAVSLSPASVLVAGGVDKDLNILSTSEIVDVGANAVFEGPDFVVARTVARLTVLSDGRVFVSGGNGSGDFFLPAPISTAEILSPDDLSFRVVPAP